MLPFWKVRLLSIVFYFVITILTCFVFFYSYILFLCFINTIICSNRRNDIVCNHDSVARFHAVLTHGPKDEIYLFDLNSTNGSYINSKKTESEYTKLDDGVEFWFGFSSEKWTLRWHEGKKVRKMSIVLLIFCFDFFVLIFFLRFLIFQYLSFTELQRKRRKAKQPCRFKNSQTFKFQGVCSRAPK